MIKLITFLLLSFTLLSCSSRQKRNDNTYMEAATLWMQNSAEVRALSYQAFNIARIRVDLALKKSKKSERLAIVLDVDETVLQNVPYQAKNILEHRPYTKATWKEWIDLAQAEPLPGAVEFLEYVSSRNIEIFYLTNRRISGFEKTFINLKNKKFPVKRKNMLLRTVTRNKEPRRQKILANYKVVLYMGDTMTDFFEIDEGAMMKKRNLITIKNRDEFGKKFILLPNPMYGEWEGAVYHHDYSLSPDERARARKNFLYPYH